MSPCGNVELRRRGGVKGGRVRLCGLGGVLIAVWWGGGVCTERTKNSAVSAQTLLLKTPQALQAGTPPRRTAVGVIDTA